MIFLNGSTVAEKRIIRRLGMLLLILVNFSVAAIGVSYGFGAWREARSIFGRLEVAVSGEGKAEVKPDIVKVWAGVVVEREILGEAQAEAGRRSRVLTEYLGGQGITGRDIRTTAYNIFPQYSYFKPCPRGVGAICPDEMRPRITGYQVRMTYEVIIRDIAKAGDVLAGIVSSGVNEVSNFQFTISEPEGPRAIAREKAIRNAREKAEVLARSLGKRVGRIVNFSESGVAPPPIMFARESALGMGGVAPAIEAGENEVSVLVSISYELR